MNMEEAERCRECSWFPWEVLAAARGQGEVCGFVPIRGNKAVFSFPLGPSKVLNMLWVQVSSLPVGTFNEGCSTEWVGEQSQEPHRHSRYGAGCQPRGEETMNKIM